MRAVGGRRIAAALVVALLAAPAPAAARVTITVQVAYGGVAVGGIGIFLYFAGSWESHLAARGLQTALLEIRDDGARFGVPLPLPDAAADEAVDGVRLDLLRWRF